MPIGSLVTDYFSLDYNLFLRLQDRLIHMRQESEIHDSVLAVFHNHVFTAGIRFKETDIEDRQTQIVRLDRGGSVTYHGPGQINVYPIVNIEDKRFTLRSYMLLLQNSVELTLRNYGIEAESQIGDHLGTWVNDKKICSYGVSVQKGVTGHGLSLNVRTDMNYFGKIKPCGFPFGIMCKMEDFNHDIPNNREIAQNLMANITKNLNIENYNIIKNVDSLKSILDV